MLNIQTNHNDILTTLYDFKWKNMLQTKYSKFNQIKLSEWWGEGTDSEAD